MTIDTKRPRGRPPVPDGKRYKQRMVRMPDPDFERIEAAAKARGVSFSEFMRTAALQAADWSKPHD